MIPKNFEDIALCDIQALVDNSVVESSTIEYKWNLSLNNDQEKREFLADISSFSNASGGDLIFGVTENRENGTPEELKGLDIANPDEEIRKIESIIRDGISPRIPSLRIKAICLSNAKTVILIRIAKSWLSPHRVVFKGWDKFFSRNAKGKYPLDVTELRIAFNLSESITDRIRKFREERISKLVANETPVVFDNNPKVIMHIVPISAFSPSNIIDVGILREKAGRLQPICSSGWNNRINFDGFIIYSGDSSRQSYTYTQFYRNGIIEAVNSSMLDFSFSGKKNIPSVLFEEELIVKLNQYLTFLNGVDIQCPVFVFLTLIGVKDYFMAVDTSKYWPTRTYTIDRDVLITPEVVVESYEKDASNILKPCFDAIWNACGWQQSLNYDEQGLFIIE